MRREMHREPAFLRDIHKNQKRNYNKMKDLNLSQRIDLMVEKAYEVVRRMDYRKIQG